MEFERPCMRLACMAKKWKMGKERDVVAGRAIENGWNW